jgi:hypothetical protein
MPVGTGGPYNPAGRVRITPGEPIRVDAAPPIAKQCPCCGAALQTATRRVRVSPHHSAVERQVKIKICAKCKVRVVLHRFPPKLTWNDRVAVPRQRRRYTPTAHRRMA